MSAHIRINRADPANYEPGEKRPAHQMNVQAVAADGTAVDISDAVVLAEIVLEPGEPEKAVVTFIAFEVES